MNLGESKNEFQEHIFLNSVFFEKVMLTEMQYNELFNTEATFILLKKIRTLQWHLKNSTNHNRNSTTKLFFYFKN